MRKRATWLVVALLGGALVAGCGGSRGSTASTPAEPGPAAAGTTSAPATTSSAAAVTTATSTASGPTHAGATASPATTGPVSAGSTSTSAASGVTTGATSSSQAGQQSAACKRTIQKQLKLSTSAKAELEAFCDKATSGNPAALQKVAQQACAVLVKASVPAGAARERALAACKAQ